MKKLGAVLFEAIKSLFKKPVTSEYPKKRRAIHDSYAGMISFEQDKCIGCQICVRNCPANAIKVAKIADKKFSCELSLANCIFCSQCVFTCPKKALHTTDNFELAQIDKSKLTVKLEDIAPKKEPASETTAPEQPKTAVTQAPSDIKKEEPAAKTNAAQQIKNTETGSSNTAEVKSAVSKSGSVPKKDETGKESGASQQKPSENLPQQTK